MKRQKVKMVGGDYPRTVPSGTIGHITDTILSNGLIEAKFGNYIVHIYPHEIEFIEEPEKQKYIIPTWMEVYDKQTKMNPLEMFVFEYGILENHTEWTALLQRAIDYVLEEKTKKEECIKYVNNKRKGKTMENYRPYDNEELEMCVGHVYIYNETSRHVVTDYINERIYINSKPIDSVYFLNHFTTVIGMPCGVKI